MTDTIDPVEFYDGVFDNEVREVLEAFGDSVNRAMFAYIVNEGEAHLDEVYETLSESKIVEEEYDDFGREDVRNIRRDMRPYINQRAAGDDLDLDDVYFEPSAKGVKIAENFNLEEMLE